MNEVLKSEDARVWRTSGGSNARCGRYREMVTGLGRSTRRIRGQAAIQASVVFDKEGNRFIADMGGDLRSVSASGERRWLAGLGSTLSATPALDPSDRVIFAATHHGEVVALDTATGGVRWRRAIPSRRDPRILSDVLVLPGAGVVVVSSWSGRFHLLDMASGEPRSDWDAGLSPRSAAAADVRETVYFLRAVAGRGIEWVRASASGGDDVLYREPEDSRGAGRALVGSAPVLDEDRGVAYLVLNREGAARLMAWSLRSGTTLWTRDLPAAVQATPSLLPGGRVVVGDLAGVVHAVDAEGSVVYRAPLGCDYLLAGGIGLEDGTWVAGDPEGKVHAVDARGVGRVVFEAARSIQAQPSVDLSGRLHVPCTDHAVHVVASRVEA